MKLNNAHRREVCKRIIDATFKERELRLRQREHALALRILRRELGKDALIRIAALPPGWLPLIETVRFECEVHRWRPHHLHHSIVWLSLDASMPVPASVAHGGIAPSKPSIKELEEFCADERAMFVEREQLETQVKGTLAAFTTVERFAEDWPDGYVHFPHPELAPTTLPAVRVIDLNRRLAAAREAA